MLFLSSLSQPVYLCSNLPCQDSLPSLWRALFESIQDLVLSCEADQDEYLFDSLGAEKIIGSKKLGKLPPLCIRIFIQKEGLFKVLFYHQYCYCSTNEHTLYINKYDLNLLLIVSSLFVFHHMQINDAL